jgi:hypothetical protein
MVVWRRPVLVQNKDSTITWDAVCRQRLRIGFLAQQEADPVRSTFRSEDENKCLAKSSDKAPS